MSRLYYVHDPMCSWCWGFAPVYGELISRLPAELEVVRLVGGLAPDSDRPMPMEMREFLQKTWRRIQQQIPGTAFNFDFWTANTPRRSTYPACRAVIAARQLDAAADAPMTRAIQQAYYLKARNPSDEDTLVDCAEEIGLDRLAFAELWYSREVDHELREEIRLTRSLGCDSFPSLLLDHEGRQWPIALDYNHATPMLDTIGRITGNSPR